MDPLKHILENADVKVLQPAAIQPACHDTMASRFPTAFWVNFAHPSQISPFMNIRGGVVLDVAVSTRGNEDRFRDILGLVEQDQGREQREAYTEFQRDKDYDGYDLRFATYNTPFSLVANAFPFDSANRWDICLSIPEPVGDIRVTSEQLWLIFDKSREQTKFAGSYLINRLILERLRDQGHWPNAFEEADMANAYLIPRDGPLIQTESPAISYRLEAMFPELSKLTTGEEPRKVLNALLHDTYHLMLKHKSSPQNRKLLTPGTEDEFPF